MKRIKLHINYISILILNFKIEITLKMKDIKRIAIDNAIITHQLAKILTSNLTVPSFILQCILLSGKLSFVC